MCLTVSLCVNSNVSSQISVRHWVANSIPVAEPSGGTSGVINCPGTRLTSKILGKRVHQLTQTNDCDQQNCPSIGARDSVWMGLVPTFTCDATDASSRQTSYKSKLNQGAINGFITWLLAFFEFKLRFIKFFRFNYTKLKKSNLGKPAVQSTSYT